LFMIPQIRYHLCWLLALLAVAVGVAQPRLSGVINHYAAVTKQIGCDSAVSVSNASGFFAGDRAMLIQMKGALIEEGNTSAFGSVVDLRSAGNYEFLTILSVNGETITFTTGFVHVYDPAHGVQLIRIPVYDDAIIDRPVVAKPWNGSTGGVVAFEVRGLLTLAAAVSADSAGFRGGGAGGMLLSCYDTTWVDRAEVSRAGEKGEGPVTWPYTPSHRGPMLLGGGGGNGHNSGGGGGGNGGRGGRGGHAAKCDTLYEAGGIGGHDLRASLHEQRLFMGGGGGGSHENRPEFQGTHGSPGGGIVYVKANHILVHPGGVLTAKAARVVTSGDFHQPGDGAGGGGAGGTILLDVKSTTGAFTCDVRGADGGDVMALYETQGPGGGGGGGTVAAVGAMPQGAIPVVRGGKAGTLPSPRNAGYNATWGARDGQPGLVEENVTFKTPKRYAFSAKAQSIICPGEQATLEAAEGFLRYRWSNGATTRVAQTSTPGSYYAYATDSAGCDHTVGPFAVRYNMPQYDVENMLDFGAVDIMRTHQRTFSMRNRDDEPIVVSQLLLPEGFTLVSPALPWTIPAGASVDVAVMFFAAEDKPYGGLARIDISAPCADTTFLTVRATVKPLYVSFLVPDTSAVVGDANFAVPIRMFVLPDTVSMYHATLDVVLSMDNRVFAPHSVTQGAIVKDIVDVIARRRTITIRLDSVDLFGGRSTTISSVAGTVLSSTQYSTPLIIDTVMWVQVVQEPITTWDDGSLRVEPPCHPDGRPIRTFRPMAMMVDPNPAREDVRIRAQVGLPGLYQVGVLDVSGRVVRNHEFVVQDEGSGEANVHFDVGNLPSGLYLVRLRTPISTHVQAVVVER
jgi:hypothetical protein